MSLLEVHVDIITYIGYRIRIQYMYSAAERLLSYHFITYTQENVSIAKFKANQEIFNQPAKALRVICV